MRVLVLSIWYPNAQNPVSGTFVHDQVKALMAQGHDVRVVHPVPAAPFPIRHLKAEYRALAALPQHEVADGVQVYHPRYVTLPRHWLFERVGGWMAAALRPLLKTLHAEWPFELIHAHATYPCGFAANQLRDELFPRLPVVHTIHRTCIIDAPNYNAACFERVRESLEGADFNIFVSREGQGLGLQYTQQRIAPRSEHIDNGVDPVKFSLSEAERAEVAALKQQSAGCWNLVFVGYLKEVKGVKELLDAVRRLVLEERRPLRLWLVGENHLGSYVGDYLVRHGLQDHVRLVGAVPHGRVKLWMSFADAFILPSHSEGTPTVMFEALFLGVPSIFSRVGGVGDVATHDENALLIPPRSVEAIESAVRRLMDDAGLAQRLGQAAHELIERRFTWARNAEAVSAVYRGLAGPQPSAGER